MKTFAALVQEAANVAEEIKAIDAWFADSRQNIHDLINARKVEEYKTMRKDMEAQEIEKSKRLELLKVAGKILKDNIRMAYFTETMPKVLEVLKKYEGKPIGEKTEKKMRDELHEIGIFFSISYGGMYSSDKIHISPLAGSDYNFSYDDMSIYTHYKEGGTKQPMFGGNNMNKLIVYDIEQYYLGYCANYVEDYESRAREIIEKYRELREKREAMEREYSAFNAILPRSMDRLEIGKHLYQSIA